MQEQRSPQGRAWQKLYKTVRWQRVRAAQLAAKPLCEYCQAQGLVTVATICDHAIAHKGDATKFFDGPFLSLCKPHHDSTKQSEEKTGKRKPVIGPDGWPVGE